MDKWAFLRRVVREISIALTIPLQNREPARGLEVKVAVDIGTKM